jgi:3-oxoadipate enol-lactonase
MITRGIGYPVVIIPGIQGRWEWMSPTVEALQAGHRVITFSLQELRPGIDPEGEFTAWSRALDKVLDRVHEREVSLIGISFGGLIAARYAARRPERVTSLIIASAPAPGWKPGADDRFCMKLPYLSLPYFGARAVVRLMPELMEARETWHLRLGLLMDHAKRVGSARLEPRLMAHWIREFLNYDMSEDCDLIKAPTLIVTGESRLDRVVPVYETKRYLRMIRGSTHQILPNTGHLGAITKPYRFAEMAGQFIYAAQSAARSATRTADEAARFARGRHAS